MGQEIRGTLLQASPHLDAEGKLEHHILAIAADGKVQNVVFYSNNSDAIRKYMGEEVRYLHRVDLSFLTSTQRMSASGIGILVTTAPFNFEGYFRGQF